LPAMSQENIKYTDTTRFKFSRRESHCAKPVIVVECKDLLYLSDSRFFNASVAVLTLMRKCTENFQVVLLMERHYKKLIKRCKL